MFFLFLFFLWEVIENFRKNLKGIAKVYNSFLNTLKPIQWRSWIERLWHKPIGISALLYWLWYFLLFVVQLKFVIRIYADMLVDECKSSVNSEIMPKLMWASECVQNLYTDMSIFQYTNSVTCFSLNWPQAMVSEKGFSPTNLCFYISL